MNKTPKAKDKYIFVLKNINIKNIEERYNISICNINLAVDKIPQNVTKISDLSSNINKGIMSFVDDAKKEHKCSISMVDFNTTNELDGQYQNCFWCRNQIPKNVIAIGCPLKFVPSQVIKSYYSEISKDTYTIKENITSNKEKKLEKLKDTNLTLNNRNYYLTDGIFCSFNCCMAYISDNKYNSLYNMSEMLLLKMYNDFYPSSIHSIDEAPHWRNLNTYGGTLSIEEFRATFNKIEYKNHGIILDVPRYKSTGFIFEEKIKF